MKKFNFSTAFFMFTIILALATEWSIVGCVFVICASLYMLIETIPQLWRIINGRKED
ncbi:hypothetical protein [uncultured Eubacterium sp.]|jgi:hypothetical protein|uniref:hypothetical protein n=1 Tax=Eubacterium sp. TaxID=142586 RepID=UPI001430C2AC